MKSRRQSHHQSRRNGIFSKTLRFEPLEQRQLLSVYNLADFDTVTHAYHSGNTNQIPSNFASDQTANLNAAISAVPNGTSGSPNTLSFPSLSYSYNPVAQTGTGYDSEGEINISRNYVTFDGNGAIIARKVAVVGNTTRQVNVNGSSTGLLFQELTVYGSNTNPHYDADRALQGAFAVWDNSDNITFNNNHVYDVWGDAFYVGFVGNGVGHVYITNNYADGTGRDGAAPCGGKVVVLDHNTFLHSRHPIDIEPESGGAKVGTVQVTNCYFGVGGTGGFDLNGGGSVGLVYVANNTSETGINEPLWVIFGQANTGPMIYVNNTWTFDDNGGHCPTINGAGGVLYAGNKTVIQTRVDQGLNAANSNNVICGENLMTGFTSQGTNLDYAWDNTLTSNPTWTSPVVVTPFAGRPYCFYATMPYTSGGHVYAIWRTDGSDDLLTYPSGLLSTHSTYAYAIVNSSGGVIESKGFDALTYYNGTVEPRMVTTSATAPTALTATPISSTRIDLTWQDNTNNETGFKIERAPDVSGNPGTFAQIGTNAANDTTYSDTTCSSGTKYWYRVRANWSTDNGDYSSNVNATTQSSSFTETWTGSNGQAWPATWTWVGSFTRDIQSNRGRLTGVNGSGEGYYNAMTAYDSSQTVQFNISSNNGQAGLISRIIGTDSDSFYAVRTGRTSSNVLEIDKVVDGTWTVLASVTLGFTVSGGSSWYSLKLSTAGSSGSTTLSAKCWQGTGADPAPGTWDVTDIDTTGRLQRAGSDGVYYWTGSTRTLLVDNYNVTW